MSLNTFTGPEAPSHYPADLHPGYWRFPEGQEFYTGIIQDLREERPFPGKPGTNLVIEVVNGPYSGKINLNSTTTPWARVARVIEALGALENGHINSARLLHAKGTPIAFTFSQFQNDDGLWNPVLRFAAVIPRIIPMKPEKRFGWSRPGPLPIELRS